MKTLENRLIKEYELLINLINRIGTTIIIVKGWTVTLVVAICFSKISFSFTEFVISVVAIVLFWYIEGYYRGRTAKFKIRMREIEEHFAKQKTDHKELASPAIEACIGENPKKYEAFNHYTYPVYLVLLVCIIGFYIFS